MKLGASTLAFLLSAAAFAQAESGGPFPQKTAFRDAATHDQLVKRLKYMESREPMSKLAPATGKDPSKNDQTSDFLKQSDIICFNGVATFVPKRAILATPAKLKDRLAMKPGARIVSWTEFLDLNRGWVNTVEVDRPQAEGNKMMEEEVSERIAKSSNLVVATYKGGPISVLPLKEKEEATETKTNPTKP
jgi:hypothetical protein